MEEREGLPVLLCATAPDWAAWLAAHPDVPGAWLVIGKKGSGVPTPDYVQALDEALCEGWVDGKKMTRDAQTYVLRFTPRRARSAWSQVNRAKVLALQAQGRLRPGGLAAVEAARASGAWDRAYPPQSRAEVPTDLRAALDAEPRAAQEWERLDSRNRYGVLHRVQDARRPETRARRIATYAQLLAAGGRLYP